MPTIISSQFKGPSNTNDGSMVAVEYKTPKGADVMATLSADDITQSGQGYVNNSIVEMETRVFQQNQRCEVRDLGGAAGALQSEPGMKQQNYIAQTFTKGAHPMNAQQPQTYEPTETEKTLNCFNNSEARAEELVAEVEKPVAVLDMQGGKIGANYSMGCETTPAITRGRGSADDVHSVAYRYAVRRITPVEGERLQGFADNWTRPCFRTEDITDELVDRFCGIQRNWSVICGKKDAKPPSRKKVRAWPEKVSSADCPDGPRYKAIGNSMSVNVMGWIGQRIDAEDRAEREAAQ